MMDDFILNEYKARQLWERRDYERAMVSARAAAASAAAKEDHAGWWRMTFLSGECQIELGQLDACAETARVLTDHEMTQEDPELATRAKALLSAVLRSSGQLHEALVLARSASLTVPEAAHDSKEKLEAQQVLVAVLAESGDLEDAWSEAQLLASMIGRDTSAEKAGKAYWSIGNVAFLMGRHEEATHFHGLAASCLSPSNDLNLWALFNKASAFMRLSANLVEPETLQCIERAELALSIAGGNEQDELDVALIRAFWRYLTGDTVEARQQMEGVLEHAGGMAPLSHGDAVLLYARIVADAGDLVEAASRGLESAALFDKAGAPARAVQARNFVEELSQAAVSEPVE
ncbi:hypothetical protein LOC59_10645 [Arthrobacter sp. zg-Y916]|uniref:hypothetical protein n=1 Tax=Arthrobacter sp. zg-Y916 TaxID=2894190 RepID=UPI001E5790A2|nr:hypothetical protein [Arthrobacter sp. zg-Y916]MCC9194097.1 hypothetical protein [Arthrobacter sp. zg-Y916]